MTNKSIRIAESEAGEIVVPRWRASNICSFLAFEAGEIVVLRPRWRAWKLHSFLVFEAGEILFLSHVEELESYVVFLAFEAGEIVVLRPCWRAWKLRSFLAFEAGEIVVLRPRWRAWKLRSFLAFEAGEIVVLRPRSRAWKLRSFLPFEAGEIVVPRWRAWNIRSFFSVWRWGNRCLLLYYSTRSLARNIQAVVVIFGVVGLRRVNDYQAGSPERALRIDLNLFEVPYQDRQVWNLVGGFPANPSASNGDGWWCHSLNNNNNQRGELWKVRQCWDWRLKVVLSQWLHHGSLWLSKSRHPDLAV